MTEYVLESDIDVLFDTNTIAFMESASTPVKKSYLQRMIDVVSKLCESLLDFISRTVSKLKGNKLIEKIKNDPTLSKKKVKVKDYDTAVDAGMNAIHKIDNAKTAKEAKKISREYEDKRKKALKKFVGRSIATVAVYVGIKFLSAHKQNAQAIKSGIKDAQKVTALDLMKDDLASVQEKLKKLSNRKSKEEIAAEKEKIAKELEAEYERGWQLRQQGIRERGERAKESMEKAIEKMMVSKHTLEDMSAQERDYIQCLNRNKYTTLSELRSKKILNGEKGINSQIEKYMDQLNDIESKLKKRRINSEERQSLEKRRNMLSGMISRAEKTKSVYEM